MKKTMRIMFSFAALAIAFVTMLSWAQPAQAQCDASCAVNSPLFPSVLMVGDELMVEAQLRANASSTGFPDFLPVEAELDCQAGDFGAVETCCVAINCVPGQNCVEEQAEVISDLFTNIQCTIIDPLVDSCTVIDAGGVQGACFTATTTLPAGFNEFPGIRLIGITADAADTVKTQSGQFGVIADVQFGALITVDDLCSPQEQGGCEGSSSGAIPPVCEVELDKQVSCDGGNTFVDVGFGDNQAESCDGWNAFDGLAAEQIVVRYVVRNPESATEPLSNCVLSENNALIGDPDDPPGLQVGAEFIFEDGDQTCSDDLAAGEPDTATVVCECVLSPTETIQVTDSDMADFACLEPRLTVEKQCTDTDDDGADDLVTIDVINVAGDNTADLVNCVVTDTLDPEAVGTLAPCPGDGVGTENVPVVPAGPFDLDAGDMSTSEGSSGNRLFPACNTASVTCEVAGSGGKTVTVTDPFPCRPLTCDVRLDKVLVVDGQRVDEGDFDPRVTGQGISWAGFDGQPPDPVDFEFVVENLGTATAECEIVDELESGEERLRTTILVPGLTTVTETVTSPCTAEIEGVDTATISCTCVDDADGTITVTDEDSAEVLCLEPGLAVVKTCDDVDPVNESSDTVNITVMNTGSADLVNCQVTDELDLGGTCPGDGQDLLGVAVAPQGFGLAAGTPGNPTEQDVSGTFPEQPSDSCNNVAVTCTIDGTNKTITADNQAPCTGVVCAVAFDKQVSCDGLTYVDVEASDDPDNAVTRGCTSWNAYEPTGDGSLVPAEPANRRFVIDNSRSNVAVECTLVDDDGVAVPVVIPGGGIVGAGETVTIDADASCSPEASVIDTATLACTCQGLGTAPVEVTPFVDQAQITCQTPRLEVTKVCEEQVGDRNAISIAIENPDIGNGATLENCSVSDPQAPECDGAAVTSPLAPGGSDTVLCGIDGLTVTTDNTATVTCDIAGTSKEISDTSTDPCEVVRECKIEVVKKCLVLEDDKDPDPKKKKKSTKKKSSKKSSSKKKSSSGDWDNGGDRDKVSNGDVGTEPSTLCEIVVEKDRDKKKKSSKKKSSKKSSSKKKSSSGDWDNGGDRDKVSNGDVGIEPSTLCEIVVEKDRDKKKKSSKKKSTKKSSSKKKSASSKKKSSDRKAGSEKGDDRDGGTTGQDVKYIYTIKNVGDVPVFIQSVEDNPLGSVPGVPSEAIDPTGSVELMLTAEISETTTNVVTVIGNTSADETGAICDAMAEATVKVVRPPDTKKKKSQKKKSQKKKNQKKVDKKKKGKPVVWSNPWSSPSWLLDMLKWLRTSGWR